MAWVLLFVLLDGSAHATGVPVVGNSTATVPPSTGTGIYTGLTQPIIGTHVQAPAVDATAWFNLSGGGGGGSGNADTLGGVICNLTSTAGAFPYILSVICYIVGVFLSTRGIYLFKKHADNPNDSKIPSAVAHLISSGIFLSLPTFASVLQNSLFSGVGGNGASGCSPPGVQSIGEDMSMIFQNFANDIYEPMFLLVAALSFCIGVLFIAKGLMKCAKIGSDPKAAASHGILVLFIVGAVLISMGEMLPAVLGSIFGSTESDSAGTFASLINWSAVDSGADTTTADETVKAVLMFVQVVGAIAFLRGWLMIKSAVEGSGGQNQTVPQGMTHVIGGAMAINIGTMITIIDHTLGTGLVNG